MEEKTMKKNIVIATVAAAAALFISSSCAKQDIDVQAVNGAKVFTASIEQGLTKTTLNDTKVEWNEKDLIDINGQEFSAVPNTKDATKATFTLSKGTTPNPPYEAIYPAELKSGEGFRFPQTQYYEPGRFNAPMYARSSSESLSFRNICGVICLRLKSLDDSETIVKSITLTTQGEAVWGDFTLTQDKLGNWDPSVWNEDPSGRTVILNCDKGVSLNSESFKEFYIYIPPQIYNAGMTVTIESTNPDCNPYIKTTGVEVAVFSNSVYTFEWEDVQFLQNAAPAQPAVEQCAKPDDALSNCVFTVGDGPADKVYFSKGNLVARCVGYGMFDFGFAEHQYAFIGNNSGNAALLSGSTLTSDQNVDLFKWSTSNNLYGIGGDPSTGDFHEWGNAVSPSNTWRTLSGGQGGEWNYLINQRVVNGGQGEGHSYEKIKNVTIGDQTVTGVVIFPDDFEYQTEWKTKFSTWADIAEAGIVFLPAAGYLDSWDTGSFEEYGFCYWSCTPNDVYACQFIWTDAAGFAPNGYNPRNDRASVRLVANAFVPGVPESQDIVLENL